MSLPKIVTPEYTVKLWSVKQPVRFRPYLVKEEKLLLTAKQAGDAESIERAMLQVLTNCTFGALDIEALPSFDVEYLFLQIRSKSVSEQTTLQYACQNIVRDDAARTSSDDDGRCNARVSVTVDLSAVALDTSQTPISTITLRDGTILGMRYPAIKNLRGVMEDPNSLRAIASVIDTITDASGNLYETRDYSMEELIEFVESMGLEDLKQFEAFFATMPRLRHRAEFHCTKCDYREQLTFEGLSAFFT